MTDTQSNLRVNGDRLWESLMDMAKIGPGVAGGNNRQTLTDEDSEGRHLFQQWCEDQGCSMGLDQMGNMFARREGTENKVMWSANNKKINVLTSNIFFREVVN